ncbi:MAG: efflux RND transporter permease subunit [Candidatus Omnitrophica bacterium]|nr:efflux RND transporter permease subunit [Candidatus Omnitrophota bacterium]
MIEFFVKKPVTTIMFVLVFVLLGFVSIFSLRVEKEPKIDFPIVTATVTYLGATPIEVETLVINKIEDAVAELSEIKKIKSYSYENFGYVSIEFLLSADVNIKFIEVKDKVDAIVNDFPEDAKKPVIEKFDPLMEPVMDLVLSSTTLDGRDLYEFADKKLKDHFSSVDGVANVDLYGGKERQINVFVDPMLMKQRYLTITDIVNSIKAKNKNIPGGLLEKTKTSVSLRFLGEFENPSDLADMIIVSRDGSHFPLKEIARIEDSFKEVETIARYNGKDVVGLSLNKVSDGNAVDISREVQRRLPEFRKLLPKGVSLEIATDTTDFIISETNQTYLNILIGIILTIFILYVFTGQPRLTFIASITIPSSIISALFLVNASGLTVNAMTLLAIATALGTLIANAIIIVENVLVHIDKGESPVDAAINGTKEVASAVLASTGTNLVVFTPIASMGGIVGQFMKSFGLTVIYATIFSLVASFSLTPMLCGLILREKEGLEKKESRFFNPFRWLVKIVDIGIKSLKNEYHKIFKLTFKFPKITVILMILCFFSLKFIIPYIGNEFYPDSDEDMITVSVEMPQGSTIERTLEVVDIIEKRLEKIPETESLLTSIGDNGVENAAVVVNLVPLAKRKRSDVEIIQEIVPFVAQIPDAEINLERGEARGGIQADMTINIYGRDYQKMINISKDMKRLMEETGYFRSVDSSYKTPKSEVILSPDQKKLVASGLTDVEVGSILRTSVYGDSDTNVYKEAGEEYDINVQLDKDYIQDFDDIRQINVISKKGLSPISEFGEITEDKAVPMIQHRDKNRIIVLYGYLAKSNSGYVSGVLDESFKKINFEDGYGYLYAGSAEYQDESSRETEKAFLLAVILTFMLLCALMNSFFFPLPILLSVVTSFIGVFYALFFLDQSINVASMLGMIMLVGLVVNNSILLLDYTLQKMKEGVPIVDALWLGASEKFRAIIMTSLAIVLGVLPQLWSVVPLKSAMGTVMIGGMLASIVFTFIFTPVSFWYVVRFQNKFFHQ